MDSVDFISSRVTKKDRERLREHRDIVLAKAEKDALKAAERREKEGGWMLPDVEKNLFSDRSDCSKKRKKSHKEKKSKKHKKEKKKSKKKKSKSSSSSSSDSEDEWVEKEKSTGVSNDEQSSRRDSWMNLGTSFDDIGKVSSKEDSSSRQSLKSQQRQMEEAERNKQLAKRELNPEIRKKYESKPSSSSGGGIGLAMIKRAVERVYDQAKVEGKTVEEVAIQRWGSMSKFREMEDKLKARVNAPQDESATNDVPQTSVKAKGSSWKTTARLEKEKEEKYKSHRQQEQDKEIDSKKEESQKNTESSSEPPTEVVTLMSEEEMNKLGAKIVKAEMLGNHDKAKELKDKLEKARQAREESKKHNASEGGTQEEVVVLSRTDSKGLTRPVDPDTVRPDIRRSGKKGKVQTHASGDRVRYFADDDRYDLKQMFHREKMSTAEDQNGMMSRLAGKAIEKTDNDDYSIDDVFVSRAAKKRSEEQDLAKERDAAIAEHKALTRTLDTCGNCFDGAEFKKHLLVAVGRTCYVTLPWHFSLTDGHCFIVPMSHVKCATFLDEDVYAEMQAFRAALCKMFAANDDQDCVFFECAKRLKRHPHMMIECVPLPREIGDMAPMYFQKAIQECESEWSHNKKLVTLSQEKGIRRSVPKGLPYFHVDFGMQNGFAHVIEDEDEFPRNFAQETIGGMLDLEPRLWRDPKREPFDLQKKKVLEFGAMWKKFDITKVHAGSSSSDED